MENPILTNEPENSQHVKEEVNPGSIQVSRRTFVGTVTTAAAAFTIVPRHVMGGNGIVSPNDKTTLAYIGVGTQGLRELLPLLDIPELQIIAVCDPQKLAIGYCDWSRDGLRDDIRKKLNNPGWQPGGDNIIPGGRDNGKAIVDEFYLKFRQEQKFNGCKAYSDFRELFEKEKDLDAVKVMTPDHLHGLIATAAIKRGKHISLHKPLSNRLHEGKSVIDLARRNPHVTTHLIPWNYNGSMELVMKWIGEGKIGKLIEVHNWSNRPVWPQYPTLPNDTPAVPKDFDWDLWLGPEANRPYHPNYTNMVFRGWYDFGGGSMADMGHYSLMSVLKALDLESPLIVEPNLSHVCGLKDSTAFQIKNDFSFPMASSVRFKYPARGTRPAIDLIWHDGGMRPQVPEELFEDGKALEPEGMMFVGDKGKILAGFHTDNPRLLPQKRMKGLDASLTTPKDANRNGFQLFLDACRSGKQCPGSFTDALPITEAVNLYAASLRSGRLLKYDGTKMEITNFPEANKYLSRTYRNGWNPESI